MGESSSKPSLRALLLAFAALALCAGTARAQLDDSARVVSETGRVSLERSGELWVLLQGQTVAPGQIVVTGPDGYAQMELPDHSMIEVFANSRVVFHPSPTNLRDLVDIFLGKIRLQIQHLTDGQSPYHVSSPTAVISIRGTVLDVEVDASQATTIEVETGVIGVRHRLMPGREVTVETGQTIRVQPGVPLASGPGASPLGLIGRIVYAAGETAVRVVGTPTIGKSSSGRTGGTSSGSGSGGATTAGAGTSSSSSASTSGGSSSGSLGGPHGTNQPAPAPGNGKDSPPGDVIP